MNRKHPRSRPFFTVRGFVVIAVAVLVALGIGAAVATLLGAHP